MVSFCSFLFPFVFSVSVWAFSLLIVYLRSFLFSSAILCLLLPFLHSIFGLSALRTFSAPSLRAPSFHFLLLSVLLFFGQCLCFSYCFLVSLYLSVSLFSSLSLPLLGRGQNLHACPRPALTHACFVFLLSSLLSSFPSCPSPPSFLPFYKSLVDFLPLVCIYFPLYKGGEVAVLRIVPLFLLTCPLLLSTLCSSLGRFSFSSFPSLFHYFSLFSFSFSLSLLRFPLCKHLSLRVWFPACSPSLLTFFVSFSFPSCFCPGSTFSLSLFSFLAFLLLSSLYPLRCGGTFWSAMAVDRMSFTEIEADLEKKFAVNVTQCWQYCRSSSFWQGLLVQAADPLRSGKFAIACHIFWLLNRFSARWYLVLETHLSHC